VFDVVDQAQIPLHPREVIFHDSKEIHNPSGFDEDSNPFERLTSLQDIIQPPRREKKNSSDQDESSSFGLS
jgi:hypothetical protein